MGSMVSELASKVSECLYYLYLEWKYIFAMALCLMHHTMELHLAERQTGSLVVFCVNNAKTNYLG